jgi:hypothetical protein
MQAACHGKKRSGYSLLGDTNEPESGANEILPVQQSEAPTNPFPDITPGEKRVLTFDLPLTLCHPTIGIAIASLARFTSERPEAVGARLAGASRVTTA